MRTKAELKNNFRKVYMVYTMRKLHRISSTVEKVNEFWTPLKHN